MKPRIKITYIGKQKPLYGGMYSRSEIINPDKQTIKSSSVEDILPHKKL